MVVFYILLISLLLLLGISRVFYNGLQNHTFYLFITSIQIFFLLITPIRNYIIGDYYAINENVKDFYPYGFFIITLHILIFNITYFLIKRRKNHKEKQTPINPQNRIIKLFLFLYIIIFINSLAGGVNLFDIIQGKEIKPTLGLQGATYYIQNFADSLITLCVAAYVFKVRRLYLNIIIISAFVLFIILGFRYRILLTIFAMVIFNIHLKGIRVKSILTYLSLLLIFFYFLLFLTYNRRYFYMQEFDKVSANSSNFEYDVIFDQAQSSLVDFALYKGLSKGSIEYDYGNSMFAYVFINMTPSSFFKNGKKPYPPPQLSSIDKAINASRDNGEACTMLGSSYYAFSLFGVIFVSIILGLIIKRIEPNNQTSIFYFLRNVMILMAIFQFYTRGYFPQFIDNLAYMLFPLLFLLPNKINVIPNSNSEGIK